MIECYRCKKRILDDDWLTDDEGEIHVYCFKKSGKLAKEIKTVNIWSFFSFFRIEV